MAHTEPGGEPISGEVVGLTSLVGGNEDVSDLVLLPESLSVSSLHAGCLGELPDLAGSAEYLLIGPPVVEDDDILAVVVVEGVSSIIGNKDSVLRKRGLDPVGLARVGFAK